MKVKELINILNTYDPDSPVQIEFGLNFDDGYGYHFVNLPINDIEKDIDGNVILSVKEI